MNLLNAMKLDPLAGGQVVAGAKGLDREIAWVQVVDHPDIDTWVDAGHLLLSTGYNWPRKGRKAAAIVERLAAKGVCGVVMAVPHFVDHFPRESLEAATRLGFPLIEVPWDVPFSAITQSVLRALLDTQAEALRRSERIHRELTEAAVAADGLQEVATVLGSVLGRDVAIVSAEGVDLAGFAADGVPPAGWYERLKARGALRAIDAGTRAVRWRPRPSRLTTTVPGVVGQAVRIRHEIAGYVLVADGAEPATELDLRAIEQAGTVAALQLSHQRALAMQEARMGFALVASLIEGSFDEKPGSFERAALMGWERQRRYRLATVLLDEPNPLTSEGFARREVLASQIRAELARLAEPVLMSLVSNQIHLLLPEKVRPESLWANLAHGRSAMGISELHRGVAGMRAAGLEVEQIVPHLLPGRVQGFDEILFPRVLAGDAAARATFVARVFEPLEGRKGSPLMDTAIALAEEGFHLERAAQRLEVHISTLRSRLARLSEATSLDMATVEGRFRLQVAVRLWMLEQA
ncbi:PucR family transcriptional regulator [Xylophilus sp. GOD-11R]|uniref:PucR family transcriptional regulator n=1 Tax=Xylophilus sp. GOD-11R TaxID=3089814 RepID=UPI00298BE920|nr:PucR family transcriptional regulator [Xylophilus sp. GOD-11R]WPB58933.1 PucR family transcriptional regulator [Xylophilus sp. GOD-11R]